jgi:uncharacterized protein
MAKLILIAIALWLIIIVLKRYRKGMDQQEGTSGKERHPTESMVQCAYCGVHIPESDSLKARGHHFCCQAHMDAPEDVNDN